MNTDSPALQLLQRDYARFHLVLSLEAGIFICVLVLVVVSAVRRFKAEPQDVRLRRASIVLGGSAGLFSVLLALVVAANMSNVINPADGLAHTGVAGTTQVGGTQVHAPVLARQVQAWVESGQSSVPNEVKRHVDARLAWQAPKAVVCSLLLLAMAAFDRRLWRRLKATQTAASLVAGQTRGLRQSMLINLVGCAAIPVTMLLMLMAMANTQAALAPLTMTVMFG